jgi:phosphoribosyl-dephospho-CoA transferase
MPGLLVSPVMSTLQRNQLVWLSEAGWQQQLARPWDAQARSILAHWHAEQLPLVVCRQRVPQNSGNAILGSVSLGLPAPLQWERRKLALELPLSAIARSGVFPLLRHIALSPTDAAQVQTLLLHTDALQVPVQVYGSHAWQWLSGLTCVRASSDMDLLVPVPDLDTAGQIVWLLQGLQLECRVDGELVFPGGWAVAWREYAQLIGGRAAQVLVKHRSGLQLLNMSQLRACLSANGTQLVPAPAQIALPSVAAYAV